MLIHREAVRERVNPTLEGRLWVTGTECGRKTWLAGAYVRNGNNCKEKNQQLVDCLKTNNKESRNSAGMILLYDIKAHTHDLDKYIDSNGKLMLHLYYQHNLVIVNTGLNATAKSCAKPEICNH